MKKWLQSLHEAYLANPNSVRDFRTQMRGQKAPQLWGLYSGILVAVAAFLYITTVQDRVMTPMELQSVLSGFYRTILGLLEAAILLAGPIMAINLITQEFERKSIDLILSSPMALRTFVLGKLLSAFRIILMILALALPMASMCVVMGGASWSEVLSGFILLALRGLLACAIAIPIAVVSKRVVPSIFAALFAIFGMIFYIGAIGVTSLSSLGPFLAAIVPFGSSWSAATPVVIGGFPFPGWAVTAPFYLGAVWLLMTGSGAALSRWGSPEQIKMRILSVLAAGLVGVGIGSLSTGITAFGSGPFLFDSPIGAIPVLAVASLLPFLCHLASWRWYGERKEAPGPLFRLSDTFAGGPSGALPFCLAVLVSAVAGGVIPSAFSGKLGDLAWVLGIIWAICAMAVGIGCYRLASAQAPMDGGYPKRLGTGYLVALAGLPLPILAIFFSFGGAVVSTGEQLIFFSLVPFMAPFSSSPGPLMANALLLLLLAVGMNGWADYLRQSKMARAANLASASSVHPEPASLNGALPVVKSEEENTIRA